MPRLPRYLIAAVLATAALTFPATAAAAEPCVGADARPSTASAEAIAAATLCLLNAERADRHLRALRAEGRLADAAERHARDMVARDYFSHTSLNGASFVDRIRRTGYLRAVSRWKVGENLAWGAGSSSTPRAVVRAWMRSRGHKANIVHEQFTQIGIGLAAGAPGPLDRDAATYATSFGFRR